MAKLSRLESVLVETGEKSAIQIPPKNVCRKGTRAILKYLDDVYKGIADPEKSAVYGSGLAPVCVACEQESFTIKAIDRLGNQKKSGGDVFEVDFQSDNDNGVPVKTEITDLGNGSYRVTYSASKAGKYAVHVRIGGHAVANSPFKIEIVPSAIEISKFKFEGLEGGEVGTQLKFCIVAHDKFGNRINEGGAEIKIINPLPTSQFQVFC